MNEFDPVCPYSETRSHSVGQHRKSGGSILFDARHHFRIDRQAEQRTSSQLLKPRSPDPTVSRHLYLEAFPLLDCTHGRALAGIFYAIFQQQQSVERYYPSIPLDTFAGDL
jgi:hypothetical protein